MDDLRSEIRRAFEKEQRASSPDPMLRQEVAMTVASRPRRASGYQWLAVAAAVLLGLLVVVGLMSTRQAHRSNVPAAPKASPVADYGPPPAGVPLIYVQDPAQHGGWLVGFDWTGKPRATVKVAIATDPLAGMSQSPDGSVFAYGFNGKGTGGQFLDRLGHPVGGAGIASPFQMWADDGVHMCVLVSGGGRWNLGLQLPGAAAPTTNVVAIDPSIAVSGIVALSFAGCSARNDQAIIEYSTPGRPSAYWVFRISDGKLLAHRTYAADQMVNFVASPDATLIAENSAKSTGQVAPAAPSTTIRRLSDMSVVNTLDPTISVIAFNGADSQALAATTPWAPGVATHLTVMDVHTGAVVWRYDGNEQLSSALVQPGIGGFAILLQDPQDSSARPSVDITIVHADGTATKIPGRYTHL